MISIQVPYRGELHWSILEALRQRLRGAAKEQQSRQTKWKAAEERMVGYIPERDVDAKRRVKRDYQGIPEYTTIQLPYTYAVLMAAHSYWSTVFLSRSPVYQFQGNNDEGEMQVQALESLMNYQMILGRMLPQHFIWLNDVGKYGEAWVSPYWSIKKQRTAQVIEQAEMYLGFIPSGRKKKVKRVQEIVSYAGNELYNIAPADVYTDPRFPRNQFQRGSFIAIRTDLSTNQLAVGQSEGRYINVEHLKARGINHSYEGEFNSSGAEGQEMERPDTNSLSSDYHDTIDDVIEAFEFTVNLIPRKWKLGQGDLPEKWVFTVDANFQTLIECRPMGNLHDKFPLAMIETEPEGYAKFSRSLVDLYGPLQNTLDWLMNTHFYNVRQTLNNQFIADPSRVEMRDFEDRRPGLMARLKPAAYGTDVRTALMQIPVADVTAAHFNDVGALMTFGERLGISDTVMGIDNPSSRRTAQEVRGNQTFSVSRLKTLSEYFSATGFSDLGAMMVQNSQQFYDGGQKVKIVGDLAAWAGQEFLEVSPEMIAGMYSFVPVDGTLPVDRFAQANLWREMITQMATVPQVAMQYDLGKIFAYTAQLMGLKNINRFKIEILPEEQLAAQAAAGNSVPLEDGMGGNPLEPGQVPLVGPTA